MLQKARRLPCYDKTSIEASKLRHVAQHMCGVDPLFFDLNSKLPDDSGSYRLEDLLRRITLAQHPPVVSYARRFKATATITTNTIIPTSHGHTADLRSTTGAAFSPTGGAGAKGAGVAV